MRTLVATVMANAKGKNIYCRSKKVTERELELIRSKSQPELEQAGFTFIGLLSLEYPNVKGKAIFFEGHLDEMSRVLRDMGKQY